MQTVGTPDMDLGATPVSSHTASRNPSEFSASFESQPNGGRHLESQTHQDPHNVTESDPVTHLHIYQALLCSSFGTDREASTPGRRIHQAKASRLGEPKRSPDAPVHRHQQAISAPAHSTVRASRSSRRRLAPQMRSTATERLTRRRVPSTLSSRPWQRRSQRLPGFELIIYRASLSTPPDSFRRIRSDEELALIAQACLIHGDNRTLLERAIRAESQIQGIIDYCSDAVSESEERRKIAAQQARNKTVRMSDGEEPLRSRGGHRAIGSTQNYEEDA